MKKSVLIYQFDNPIFCLTFGLIAVHFRHALYIGHVD